MKVLLVSVNREKIPYPVAPLGVLCLADAIGKENHEVSILDLCFSDDVAEDIEKTVRGFLPDLVGVSIRNVDNLTYPGAVSYLPDIKNSIDNLRANTSSPIVLGGSAFSLFPEDILRNLDCKLGVIGEGEKAFPAIIERIEKGSDDFSGIDNAIWLSEGSFRRNPVTHANENTHAILRGLIDNTLYSERGGMGNLQTKRGCQFNCCYCTYPILEGKGYRLRSPDIVAEEMVFAYKEHGIKHFFFVDNIFNYPEDHAKGVCKSITKKRLPVEWSCFANPLNLTNDLLELMREAGCTNIELGTDALSSEVLSRLGKSFSIDDAFNVSRLCKKVGIKCAHYIMFGGPGETLQTLHEAFRNIEKIECNAVIVMVGIRIYPGTALEMTAIQDGIISENADLLSPHFYLSPKIPPSTLLKEVTDFASANSKCIVPGLGIKSSEKMLEMLRKYFKDGPLWGYLGG
jgi:radical SAM superfamily enzyme YgiQ (UPF0313 family)